VRLREELRSPHWIVVATAHPAKFDAIVEPLVGHAVDVPPELAGLLARPARVTEIEPDLERLIEALG
jgi:threonine synthase